MYHGFFIKLLPCILICFFTACNTGRIRKDTLGSHIDVSDANTCESTDGTHGSTGCFDLAINEQSMASALDETALFETAQVLSSDELRGRGNRGRSSAKKARAIIINRLQSCGIQPVTDAGYEQTVSGTKCINVIGRVPGKDPALQNQHIMLSAHYNPVGSCKGQICKTGSHNASAVAAVMEISCAAAKHPAKRPLLVALWDCEEPPRGNTKKKGSEYFAAHPTVSLENISASIVLDRFGSEMWPGFNGLFVLGTESSDVLRSVVDRLEPEEGLNVYSFGLHAVEQTMFGHTSLSDYNAFRDRQIPIIFVSDDTNKTSRRRTDSWDQISQDKLLFETRYVFDMTRNIMNSEEAPTWQGHPHLGKHELESVIEVSKIALGKTDTPAVAETIELSPISTFHLESDFKRLKKIRSRLDRSGGGLTKSDIVSIRKGTQRLMCLTGSDYQENFCWLL